MKYTTVEQSKKLLELGLNPNSADMYYGYKKEKPEYLPYEDIEIMALCIPCWSVDALLEILPMHSTLDHEVNGWWCCVNFDIVDTRKDNEIQGTNPLEALYNMVVWLLENNYIKTE